MNIPKRMGILWKWELRTHERSQYLFYCEVMIKPRHFFRRGFLLREINATGSPSSGYAKRYYNFSHGISTQARTNQPAGRSQTIQRNIGTYTYCPPSMISRSTHCISWPKVQTRIPRHGIPNTYPLSYIFYNSS
jgi:hypothetical protein